MEPWVKVAEGRLWLRGRPGLRLVAGLKALGCDRVVTLLSEREGAPALGEAVRKAGVEWTWLPLSNGKTPAGEDRARVLRALPLLVAALGRGESLLIHCAAGIHRTGMIAHALLRAAGLDAEAARATLQQLRAETSGGMQSHHFAFADALVC
jgi:hypothetical protein